MATNIAAILTRLGFTTSAPAQPVPPAPVTPDCAPWCGGRGARRLPTPHRPLSDAPTSYIEKMRAVRYEYCSCAAGTNARQVHESALAALEAAAAQRQSATALDAAELPVKLRRYGLDDYPQLGPLIDKLRRWQSPSRSAGTNLLLYGDIGTYKTTLTAALLREHLADGGSGLFLPVGDFLGRIRESYASGASGDDKAATEWTLIRAASTPGLLVLDDIPLDLSEWARGILFRLLNARDLNERATAITTNLDLAQLEAALGKRTFDRFRGGMADPTTGESFAIHFGGASRRGLAVVPPERRA